MKTNSFIELEATGSLYRVVVPALAWAALLAYFAIAGALPSEEPRQIAQAAPALVQGVDEADGMPTLTLGAPSVPTARAPALRDATILAHEALDPVGVGIDATH